MFLKFHLAALVAAVIGFACVDAHATMAPTSATASAAEGARPNTGVSYGTFHDRLASHGTWMHNDRWGEVWRPGISGYRPYFDRGHWVYTADYGWYWDADDAWGDVVFHYGRWVFDPAQGWVWIPGYVWGPSWVVWRWGDGYAGWMPAPPDYAFLTGGLDINFSFGAWDVGFFGYQGWYGGAVVPANLWVFVGAGHLVDPGFARFAVPRERIADMMARTRTVTRYSVSRGFVVNRGIDVRQVERASGHSIPRVSGTTLARSSFTPMRASAGHALAMREMKSHPVAASTLQSMHRTTALQGMHRTASTVRTTHVSRTSAYHAQSTHGARYSTSSRSSTRYSHNYSHSNTAMRTHSSSRTTPYRSSGYAGQTYRPSTGYGAMHGPSGGGSHAAPAPHPSGGHAPAPPNNHKPGG